MKQLLLALILGVSAFAQTAGEVKVWVNQKTHIYHCAGDKVVAKHPAGYVEMTQAAAKAAGNRPARYTECK